jgi:hypothetical protein
MKTIIFMILAAVGLAETAHGQVGLTLSECEDKFGKGQPNHGGIEWNNVCGLKMSIGEPENDDPITMVFFTGKHISATTVNQILDYNAPDITWMITDRIGPGATVHYRTEAPYMKGTPLWAELSTQGDWTSRSVQRIEDNHAQLRREDQ